MKNYKTSITKNLSLLLIMFALIFFVSESVKAQQTYLKNETNSAVTDTVNTATTNDTTYTYKNIGYKDIWVQVYQNSTFQTFKLNSVTANMKVRIVYNAGDTSFYVQEKGLLGWYSVPVITTSSSTNAVKYKLPDRTGTAIVTFAIKD